jgi:hypothetical protein
MFDNGSVELSYFTALSFVRKLTSPTSVTHPVACGPAEIEGDIEAGHPTAVPAVSASHGRDRVDSESFLCPVCFIPLDSSLSVHNELSDAEAQPAITTSCGHAFCEACLRESFKRSPNKCPMCRSIAHEQHENDEVLDSCALCVANIPRSVISAEPENELGVDLTEQSEETMFVIKLVVLLAVLSFTFCILTKFDVQGFASLLAQKRR